MSTIKAFTVSHADEATRQALQPVINGLWNKTVKDVSLLKGDEDIPATFYIVSVDGRCRMYTGHLPEAGKHAFIESMRGEVAAVEQPVRFAGLLTPVFLHTPLPLGQTATPATKTEAIMLHLELPTGEVAQAIATMQRNGEGAPTLSPLDVQWMPAGAEMSGGMVGFFPQHAAALTKH